MACWLGCTRKTPWRRSRDQTRDVLSFGPFRLVVRERLLTKASAPVDLGGRTLDTLIALLARPNEVVSKRDLLAQVWPDVSVEEGSLRFHITSLRKALGDGKAARRYIATVAGRGYCFVAPVSRSNSGHVHTGAAPSFPYSNLPSRLMRMVGRDDDVLKISSQLGASRLVTIVGAGGIGKTTAAIATAHHLLEPFAGAVLFVDLAMLSDPSLVATAAASMLGLSVQSSDATPNLIAHLRDKRHSPDLRYLRASHRCRRNVGGRSVRSCSASPYPGNQSRGSSGRGRARLPAGAARRPPDG